MINKMVTKEINYLNNKICKLEENLDYWKKAAYYWCDKCDRLEDRNNHLKAEITYWKETSEYWKNQCKEFDYKLNNQIKYNIYLEKELNKKLDK